MKSFGFCRLALLACFSVIFTASCSTHSLTANPCATTIHAAADAELIELFLGNLTSGVDPLLMIEEGFPIVDEAWMARIQRAKTRAEKARLFLTAIRGNLEPQPGVIVHSSEENQFDVVNDARMADWIIGGKDRVLTPKEDQELMDRYGYNERWWDEHLVNVRRWLAARRITANWTRLPEVMTFTEVENEAVLQLIAKAVGSTSWMRATHGRYESRGINIGVIYNSFESFKERGGKYADLQPVLGTPQYRDEIEFQGQDEGLILKTRPAHVVGFENATIIVIHAPSMRRGAEYRRVVYQQIAKYLNAQIERDPSKTYIVLGDFNTKPTDVDDEGGSPLEPLLKPDHKKLKFLAANPLRDARDVLMATDPELAELLPEGSHNYRGKWEWLDRILVVTSATTGAARLQLDPTSFEAWDFDFILMENGRPNRFNPRADPKDWGYSDHLPVSIRVTR